MECTELHHTNMYSTCWQKLGLFSMGAQSINLSIQHHLSKAFFPLAQCAVHFYKKPVMSRVKIIANMQILVPTI